MSFAVGEILLVPVTFSDGSGHKKRPVVIIYDSGDADLPVAPVTSQAARSARDVSLVNWQQAGLRLPSFVRLEKLATVQKSTIIKRMGKVAMDDREKIRAVLKRLFADILSH